MTGDLDEYDFLEHTDKRAEHHIDDAEHAHEASTAQIATVHAAAIEAMKRVTK